MRLVRHERGRWPRTADVAIIGGGPVGCVTALAHAARGAEVLVLEARAGAPSRFAGEWLHPEALEVLHKYGVELAGRDTGGFVVFPEDGGEPIRLPYPASRCGVVAEHVRIVDALRDAARAHPGIRLVHAARVVALGPDRVVARLHEVGERVCTVGRIVGADGRTSFTRQAIGIPRRERLVSFMAGVTMTDAELPFEGLGHIFLGGPGPVLVYRVDARTVRVCFDVPVVHARRVRDPGFLLLAYGPVVPAGLRRAMREALQAGEILATPNLLSLRTELVRGRVALVGDAGGHCHPLTAVGMTLGFLDGDSLASSRRLSAYQRRRVADTKVAQLLSHGLHRLFCEGDEAAASLRRAVYRVWRSGAEPRRRTMDLLTASETGLGRFGVAWARVVGGAMREIVSTRLGREHWRATARGLIGLAAGSFRSVTGLEDHRAGHPRFAEPAGAGPVAVGRTT